MDNKALKIALKITIITSVLITIISRLNIDVYTQKIILPIIIILAGYTFFINLIKREVNLKAYWYLFLILVILLSYYIVPLALVNKFLNIIVVPILTVIYVFSLLNPNFKLNINLPSWFIKLFPGYLFSNLEYVSPALKTVKINTQKNKNIIKGILITLPILIIIVSLLTNADAYFKMFINNILSTLKIDISIGTIYSIVITLVLSFIFIFSTTLNIYQRKDMEDPAIKKKSVDNTITYILLILINLVYVLFLISEISKLTTNFLNIPVEYTHAQYAREGFFELLGVSTINFIILIFYRNLLDYKPNKYIKVLLSLLIVFSIFIIINSYYRMGLYIFEYSFTILRLQVLLFLTMELIFFIVLSFKKIKPSFSFILLTVTYLLNIYLCHSDFINYINGYFKYWIK